MLSRESQKETERSAASTSTFLTPTNSVVRAPRGSSGRPPVRGRTLSKQASKIGCFNVLACQAKCPPEGNTFAKRMRRFRAQQKVWAVDAEEKAKILMLQVRARAADTDTQSLEQQTIRLSG